MKKGFLIGFLLIALIGGVCIGGCGFLIYWAVSSAKEIGGTAEEFLALASQGKDTEAYSAGSSGLRSKYSREEFSALLRRLEVSDYSSITWSGVKVVNDKAALEGSMTTKKGTTVPLLVSLIKEGEVWRVDDLMNSVPAAGAATSPAPKTPPASGPAKPPASDPAKPPATKK